MESLVVNRCRKIDVPVGLIFCHIKGIRLPSRPAGSMVFFLQEVDPRISFHRKCDNGEFQIRWKSYVYGKGSHGFLYGEARL